MRTITKRAGATFGVAADFTDVFLTIGDKAASGDVAVVTDDTGAVEVVDSDLIVADVFTLSNGDVRFWLLDGTADTVYYLRVRVYGTTSAGVAGVFRDVEIIRVVVSAH